jgi:hypothetical protein
MDEMAQTVHGLRERCHDVTMSFLRTDLEIAHTFCNLAKSSQDPDRFNMLVRAAHSAVETVSTFMWKTKLDPRELDHLTAKLELLKFELESLD